MARVSLRLVAAVLVAAATAGCTNESASRRALEAHGFTDIRFTGYRLTGCDEEDSFQTMLIRLSPNVQIVDALRRTVRLTPKSVMLGYGRPIGPKHRSKRPASTGPRDIVACGSPVGARCDRSPWGRHDG